VLYNKNNKALISLLNTIKSKVSLSRSREELDAVISELKSFPGGYQLKTKVYWAIFTGLLLATTVFGYWDWSQRQYFQQSTWIIIAIGGLLTVLAGVTAYYPHRLMSKVSHALLQRDGLFDNNLTLVSFNGKATAQQFQQRFSEFHRGNYSREIKELFKGSYQGDEYSFDYHYYHFHYVDERIVTETYTDSNGRVRTRTRREYDHYDRYGLILPFGLLRNFVVIGFNLPGAGKATYKPASNRFNKMFKVVAASEIEAAKAMKPTVVVAFEELSNVLSKINFEVNDAADLCLSFADKDLIATPNRVKISEFDAFIEALEGEQEFEKLRATLSHVHYVMTKLDSNF